MKNLKDILLEKLKVSKNTNILSFTFDDLCKSILRFVDKNISKSSIVYRFDTEHVIKISNLDYFKDNPLIIQDDAGIKWIDRFIKGCKVGMMLLNTNNPQCIVGYTTDRSITLNNSNALDKSFDITEKNFTQIFNIDDLEKLYEILNEDI